MTAIDDSVASSLSKSWYMYKWADYYCTHKFYYYTMKQIIVNIAKVAVVKNTVAEIIY